MANKQDVGAAVGTILGVSKKDGLEALEAVIQAITEILVSGDEANIAGFAKFGTKNKAAGTATNLALLTQLKEQGVSAEDAKAQSKVATVAKTVPTFKALKGLKDAVNV